MENFKNELIEAGCDENDNAIEASKEKMDSLMSAYTWHETDHLYYVDGIDNAVYYIEKEKYNN